MINKTFHCKFPETCMENRKTREDLTKANTDLMFEVEELTKLVASLEEVRAKEYAFKQAKIEDLRRGLDDMTGMYRVACENRAAAYAKVEELEAQLSMHSDIDRLVVRTIKKLDELDIVKEEGE